MRKVFCFGSRRKTEMEKDEIFGDRKYFFGGEEKWGRKMRKIFGEGKYFFTTEKKNGEGKGGE